MRNIDFLKENLIAHRGLYEDGIPENSISSFERAIKFGYIVELDIHLLKDDNIVVFHDDNLKRMYDKDIALKNSTYDELKQYNIPLLKDVLALVNGQVPLIIELKCDRDIGLLENEVTKYLDNYNGKFAVKSFDPRRIRWFKINRPNYIRGVLFTDRGDYPVYLIYLYTRILVKPDFISVRYTCLDKWYIRRYRKKVLVLTWVIRNKKLYSKLKDKADNYIGEGMDKWNINFMH